MTPSLALLLWLVLLSALLFFDPARNRAVSGAVWVPVIWMFIVGSRLPAQWLNMKAGISAQATEEGSPLDRSVFIILILMAIGILMSRSFKWGDFLARNLSLTAFLSFALVSVLWSDFPLIAFKRFYRDLGNYLVILVALSDRQPLEAVRTLLRRVCFLLVPLSILLIKYYPIGIHYSIWTGAPEYVGAATSKNMLGVLCLVSGIFFFWDTVARWSDRRVRRERRIIVVNVTFIPMTLWLLHLSHSATSTVCLVLGCLVIIAAHRKAFQRRPGFFKALIPACFLFYVVLAFGFGMNGDLAGAVGRDPTLTDRTVIWTDLLAMHTNPLLGTGYETFWLGPRLLKFWQTSGLLINEAHNGYLSVYLNLGLIGLFLLVGFIIASYQTIWKKLDPFSILGSLSLAVWTILLFYNCTEAAFGGGLLWLTLLPGAMALTRRTEGRAPSLAAPDNAEVTGRFAFSL